MHSYLSELTVVYERYFIRSILVLRRALAKQLKRLLANVGRRVRTNRYSMVQRPYIDAKDFVKIIVYEILQN